jgi:hypothetical protein
MRALLAFVLVAASCDLDPRCQGKCDPATEVCSAGEGCAFLQNGNPNPFGEADRYTCIALPTRCTDDRTCACVLCDDDTQEDCVNVGTCSDPVDDDAPVLFVSGCE